MYTVLDLTYIFTETNKFFFVLGVLRNWIFTQVEIPKFPQSWYDEAGVVEIRNLVHWGRECMELQHSSQILEALDPISAHIQNLEAVLISSS